MLIIRLLLLVCAISIFCPLFSCEDSAQPEEESSCRAIVSMQLTLGSDNYSLNGEVTNSGDRRIMMISIPYTMYFTDNSTDSRSAQMNAMDVTPGETETVNFLISPANQNPYSPRWIKIGSKVIDRVEYSEPAVTCHFN
ncbi:hypothetical protein HQ531_07760 [bacterium]|nr:hypothetical protein [bacterium]